MNYIYIAITENFIDSFYAVAKSSFSYILQCCHAGCILIYLSFDANNTNILMHNKSTMENVCDSNNINKTETDN